MSEAASAAPLPLAIDELAVRYPGRKAPSLADVTLAVAAGERVGVAGRTGAGKSTLALAAAGFIPRVVRARVDGPGRGRRGGDRRRRTRRAPRPGRDRVRDPGQPAVGLEADRSRGARVRAREPRPAAVRDGPADRRHARAAGDRASRRPGAVRAVRRRAAARGDRQHRGDGHARARPRRADGAARPGRHGVGRRPARGAGPRRERDPVRRARPERARAARPLPRARGRAAGCARPPGGGAGGGRARRPASTRRRSFGWPRPPGSTWRVPSTRAPWRRRSGRPRQLGGWPGGCRAGGRRARPERCPRAGLDPGPRPAAGPRRDRGPGPPLPRPASRPSAACRSPSSRARRSRSSARTARARRRWSSTSTACSARPRDACCSMARRPTIARSRSWPGSSGSCSRTPTSSCSSARSVARSRSGRATWVSPAADVARARRRQPGRGRPVRRGGRPTRTTSTCRGASSWRWPGSWRWIRRCWSSTSPRPGRTATGSRASAGSSRRSARPGDRSWRSPMTWSSRPRISGGSSCCAPARSSPTGRRPRSSRPANRDLLASTGLTPPPAARIAARLGMDPPALDAAGLLAALGR